MKKQIHFGNKSSKSNLDFKKLNELQERLQGTSENSNPVTDPFKFLGEFDSYDELNATLDTLTYSLGYQKGYGYFRARVGDRAIEVKSILMSSGLNVVGQVVQGMLSLDGNKKLSSADSTYKIYFRKHQNNVWGEWKEITGTTSGDGSVDLSDYVKGIQLSQGLIINSKNNIIDLEGVFVEYSTLSEYLKASDAESTYLKKTAKAASATTADSATKAIQDGNGNNIVNTYATEEYVDTEVTTLWENIDQKQDTLVSGTNIKTINNQSILGKGNIVITGSGETIDLSEYLKASDAKSTYATKTELEELDSYVVKTIQINDTSYFPDPEKDEGVLKLPFKTINGTSIIGSGNIEISGGDGSVDLTDYVKKTELATINGNSLFEGGNITITGSGGADPFKYIYADDYVDLSNQLDRLTPSEDNIGFFRAKINNKTIEIQHILLVTDFTYSLQIVKGAIKIDEENNLRIADDAEYRVLYRKFEVLNFNAWEEYAGTLSSDIDINDYLKIEEAAETYATKAEVETMRFYPLVNHGTSDTTFELTPNTFHMWGIVSSLTLTFGSETSGVANEYLFQFSCLSSVATMLSLPSSVIWTDGEAPTIEVMKTYQVSILNNCATIQSFG